MLLDDNDLQWAKQALRKTEIFSICSDEELALLLNGLEKEHYRAGSTILFQGEISSRLYLVESGKVSVWARKNKEKTKVAELDAGSYFGEISLLTPQAANASIKAESETEIVMLPGEIVGKLINKNPALSNAIKHKIEERLVSRQKAMDNEHK